MDKEFKGDDPALIALWRLGVELEYKVGWANAVWFARANDKIPPYADETYRIKGAGDEHTARRVSCV